MSYAAADVSDVNESTIRIYRHDGSSWSQLSGCSVDTGAKSVTCTTTAFSTFSIFGEASGGGGGGAIFGGGRDYQSGDAGEAPVAAFRAQLTALLAGAQGAGD